MWEIHLLISDYLDYLEKDEITNKWFSSNLLEIGPPRTDENHKLVKRGIYLIGKKNSRSKNSRREF